MIVVNDPNYFVKQKILEQRSLLGILELSCSPFQSVAVMMDQPCNNNSSEQRDYDAIDLTFQCGREHLWYLRMDGFIVEDFHIFKAMTRAVLEFEGYKFNGGEYLHGTDIFEKTSEQWTKDSKSYILHFPKSNQATERMLIFWNTDDHKIKLQQFSIFKLSQGQCAVKENKIRDRLLAFFEHASWRVFPFSETMIQ